MTHMECLFHTILLLYTHIFYSYYGTLIGTPTPGIQWYKFRPHGVTPNRGMGPREALFVKLLRPLVIQTIDKLRTSFMRTSFS